MYLLCVYNCCIYYLQGQIDASLFLIKHLLILREQIAAFNVNFSVKEVYLDFTKTRSVYMYMSYSTMLLHLSSLSIAAAYNLLKKRSRIFSLSTNNSFLEFLFEGFPELIETQLDSRKVRYMPHREWSIVIALLIYCLSSLYSPLPLYSFSLLPLSLLPLPPSLPLPSFPLPPSLPLPFLLKEVDKYLKEACEVFISHTSQSLSGPLRAILGKYEIILDISRKESQDPATLIGRQPYLSASELDHTPNKYLTTPLIMSDHTHYKIFIVYPDLFNEC